MYVYVYACTRVHTCAWPMFRQLFCDVFTRFYRCMPYSVLWKLDKHFFFTFPMYFFCDGGAEMLRLRGISASCLKNEMGNIDLQIYIYLKNPIIL